MPSPPLPADVLEFLAGPRPAVVATVAPDGRPITVATWYLLEPDGTILLSMDAGRLRLRHLRRDPRLSLTILGDEWTTHASVQGRVVSMTDDEDLRDIDRLSRQYLGIDYPDRDRPRVSARVAIEKWHAWTAGRANQVEAPSNDAAIGK